jgi:hypothetical protein
VESAVSSCRVWLQALHASHVHILASQVGQCRQPCWIESQLGRYIDNNCRQHSQGAFEAHKSPKHSSEWLSGSTRSRHGATCMTWETTAGVVMQVMGADGTGAYSNIISALQWYALLGGVPSKPCQGPAVGFGTGCCCRAWLASFVHGCI